MPIVAGSMMLLFGGYLLLGGSVALNDNASAATTTTEPDLNDDTLSITAPSAIQMDLTPNFDSVVFSIAEAEVSVTTTSSYGYSLYIGTSGADGTGTATTDLIHTTASGYTIPSITAATTESNFPTNSWGYTTDNNGTDTALGQITAGYYQPFATTTSDSTLIKKTSTAATSDTTNVTFATKIDSQAAAGEYSNTVAFSAIANTPATVDLTINYNANSGSGAPASSTTAVTYNTTGSTILSSTTPTRTGYTFLGWSTSSSATSATYTAGGTYTTDSALTSDTSITLYAVWKIQTRTLTIKYNANSGSGAPSSQSTTVNYNSTATITLSSTKPTRTNYTFQGWSTSSSATSATYSAGGKYTKANLTSNTTVTLYAVWKVKSNIFSITTMQQMTSTICSNTTTPSSSATSKFDTNGSHDGDTAYVPQTTLTDTRDSSTYTVRKLADGNCWMVENLALGKSSSMTLTPNDSDVSSNYTLPAFTSIGTTWDSGINDAHTIQGSTTNSSSWVDGMGNWYTWGAATAGTASSATTSKAVATDSICPKGWQLPDYSGDKSFYNLITTTYSIANSSTGSTALRSAPFSFTYSGWYSYGNGSISSIGGLGYYWSSTAHSSTGAYILSFSSSDVYPQNYGYRGNGRSIRCVAQ